MTLPSTDADRAAYVAEAARRAWTLDEIPNLSALPELFFDPCPSSVWVSERDVGAAAGVELHAIGVHEGERVPGPQPEPRVAHPIEVVIAATERPVDLFLMSYQPIRWILTPAAGARLRGVYLSSYHASSLVCTAPLEFVLPLQHGPHLHWLGRPENPREDGPRQIFEKIEAATRLPLASFQGDYYGARYRVPCYRDAKAVYEIRAKQRSMLAEATGVAPGPFWVVDGDWILHHGGSEQPIPAPVGDLRAVAYDELDRRFFAIGDHRLFMFERGGSAVEVTAPFPGAFSWLGGVAIDSKRRRLVVTTRWHAGQHLIQDLVTGAWTIREVGDDAPGGVQAIAYEPGRDKLLAVVGSTLSAFTPDLVFAGTMPNWERLELPQHVMLPPIQLAAFAEGKAVVLVSREHDLGLRHRIQYARLVDLRTQEVSPLEWQRSSPDDADELREFVDGNREYARRTGHYETGIEPSELRRDAPRALAHLARRTEGMKRMLTTHDRSFVILANREHARGLVASVAETTHPDWELRLARARAELDAPDLDEPEDPERAADRPAPATFTPQATADLACSSPHDRAAVLDEAARPGGWLEGAPMEGPFEGLMVRTIGEVDVLYELRDEHARVAYLRRREPARAEPEVREPTTEGAAEDPPKASEGWAREAAERAFTWDGLPDFRALPELLVTPCPAALFLAPIPPDEKKALHAIGIAEAPSSCDPSDGPIVRVTVRATAQPVVLYLMSRSRVLWEIDLELGARLSGIGFSGPEGCRVRVDGEAQKIIPMPRGPREISLDADRPEHVGRLELLHRLRATGRCHLTSFQGETSRERFVVPPQRDPEAVSLVMDQYLSLAALRAKRPSAPFWLVDRGWVSRVGESQEPTAVPDRATKGAAHCEADGRLYAITDSLLYAIAADGAVERIEIPGAERRGRWGGITYDRCRGRILLASSAPDGVHHVFDPVARTFHEIPATRTGGGLHGIAHHEQRDVVFALRGNRLWAFTPELEPLAEIEHTPLPFLDLDERPTAIQLAALPGELAICAWDEIGARAAMERDCDARRYLELGLLLDLASGELHFLAMDPLQPRRSDEGQRCIWVADLQRFPERILAEIDESTPPILVESRSQPSVLLMSYQVYEGLVATLEEVAHPDWRARLERARAELGSRVRASEQVVIEPGLQRGLDLEPAAAVYVWTPQAAEDLARVTAETHGYIGLHFTLTFRQALRWNVPLAGPFADLELRVNHGALQERVVLQRAGEDLWIAWLRERGARPSSRT